MKGILNKDIVSLTGKKKTVYGANKELVKIISDRGNILIVEGKTGRFPVNKKDVQII